MPAFLRFMRSNHCEFVIPSAVPASASADGGTKSRNLLFLREQQKAGPSTRRTIRIRESFSLVGMTELRNCMDLRKAGKSDRVPIA